MASPTEINTQQLNRLIGTPDCPAIVDVRTDEDFADEPQLIPGAFRHRFDDMEGLGPRLTGSKVIVYCQKGHKISQGAAAILRARGIATETLEGGQFSWRDAGFPMVRAAAIPQTGDAGNTRWVTRQRPKVDRIACPWLIRRFVDPNAQFLFVAASQVENVAEKFNATAFDIENTFWSHRGEKCTFDTLLEEFALKSAPLDRLAKIIRAADTNRLDTAPEAAGLLAASLGLSRMYRDDLQLLEAGLALYDAFYRWSRDATDEVHDWPTNPAKR